MVRKARTEKEREKKGCTGNNGQGKRNEQKVKGKRRDVQEICLLTKYVDSEECRQVGTRERCVSEHWIA